MCFETFEPFISLIFKLFLGHGKPRITETANTESVNMGVQTLNNILVKEQFGFRCNTCTEIAIYALVNNVLTSLNDKKIVGGLFCDLKKAFDCVNYDILLSKIKFYSISGFANKLMESYL
jgi:hypothetical protein